MVLDDIVLDYTIGHLQYRKRGVLVIPIPTYLGVRRSERETGGSVRCHFHHSTTASISHPWDLFLFHLHWGGEQKHNLVVVVVVVDDRKKIKEREREREETNKTNAFWKRRLSLYSLSLSWFNWGGNHMFRSPRTRAGTRRGRSEISSSSRAEQQEGSTNTTISSSRESNLDTDNHNNKNKDDNDDNEGTFQHDRPESSSPSSLSKRRKREDEPENMNGNDASLKQEEEEEGSSSSATAAKAQGTLSTARVEQPPPPKQETRLPSLWKSGNALARLISFSTRPGSNVNGTKDPPPPPQQQPPQPQQEPTVLDDDKTNNNNNNNNNREEEHEQQQQQDEAKAKPLDAQIPTTIAAGSANTHVSNGPEGESVPTTKELVHHNHHQQVDAKTTKQQEDSPSTSLDAGVRDQKQGQENESSPPNNTTTALDLSSSSSSTDPQSNHGNGKQNGGEQTKDHSMLNGERTTPLSVGILLEEEEDGTVPVRDTEMEESSSIRHEKEEEEEEPTTTTTTTTEEKPEKVKPRGPLHLGSNDDNDAGKSRLSAAAATATIDRVKVRLYTAGCRAHRRGAGSERLFGKYWSAMMWQFKAILAGEGDKQQEETRDVLSAFLITKKLRRLHNTLVFGKRRKSSTGDPTTHTQITHKHSICCCLLCRIDATVCQSSGCASCWKAIDAKTMEKTARSDGQKKTTLGRY